MRFFYAVVCFAVAAFFLVLGLLVRIFLSPPDTLTQSIDLKGTAPITIIDSKELRHVSSAEIITVTDPSTLGGETSKHLVLAWGRTADVMAWVGSSPYQFLTIARDTGKLTESPVSGIEPEVPDPTGSDLWVQEWVSDKKVVGDLALHGDQSIIIASDGTAPAPSHIVITWKLDIDRTIPTILVYIGVIAGIGGVGAFLWGLWRERRQRRHRQGRMPRSPKPPRWRPRRSPLFGGALRPSGRRGRRLSGFIAAALIAPLVLTGCVSVKDAAPTPTPVATGDLPYVAVTPAQFKSIRAKIIATLKDADDQHAENIAATRVDGASLRFREATYHVKAADAALGTLFTIPNGIVSLMLPQQTEGWPRSVFAIIDDTENADAPSVAVVLTQNSPRTNYHLLYSFALEPGVVMPEVPSSNYGTSVLAGDTELLSATPAQVAEQYGDLLLNGEDSPYLASFTPDSLQSQIGRAAKQKRASTLAGTAVFSWAESMTEDEPVVFATTDAGALVALTLNESETVRPASAGAAISTEGAIKILSGRPSSLRGITANYQYQLLFYVPSLGKTDQIRLLGYSYALVSAGEAG